MSDERDVVRAEQIFGQEACSRNINDVLSEVVRAWVARDGGDFLWIHHRKPHWDDDRHEWLSGGLVEPFHPNLFPTLAPGECWPVEIRRVIEEAP